VCCLHCNSIWGKEAEGKVKTLVDKNILRSNKIWR
jgi:hypothetical protein